MFCSATTCKSTAITSISAKQTCETTAVLVKAYACVRVWPPSDTNTVMSHNCSLDSSNRCCHDIHVSIFTIIFIIADGAAALVLVSAGRASELGLRVCHACGVAVLFTMMFCVDVMAFV